MTCTVEGCSRFARCPACVERGIAWAAGVLARHIVERSGSPRPILTVNDDGHLHRRGTGALFGIAPVSGLR